jgi:uroporphyrinogen-III synthase
MHCWRKALAKSLLLCMAEAKPLTGLNIVVTRPRDQAAKLATRIAHEGGNVILFPLLEISPVADPQPLRELVARLPQFNLAVFVSPNAARYGMQAIQAAGTLPPTLKIAAVGQGTMHALHERGAVNAIAPMHNFDSEGLLALPELQNVRGWLVVIFRGNEGRELLGDTLKARGAQVEYAACYQRLRPQQDINELLGSELDALTITSSEALTYLWAMLDRQGRERLAAVPLFAPHERIAEAARNLGWRSVMSTAGGSEGLLAGLISWASSRKA